MRIVNKVDVGQRIKDLRKQKTGLNQELLADKLGLSNLYTLAAWEQGKNYPSPEAVQQLAEIFGVSVQWIYTGEEPPPARLEEDESRLLRAYRTADAAGKKTILVVAIDAALDAVEPNNP